MNANNVRNKKYRYYTWHHRQPAKNKIIWRLICHFLRAISTFHITMLLPQLRLINFQFAFGLTGNLQTKSELRFGFQDHLKLFIYTRLTKSVCACACGISVSALDLARVVKYIRTCLFLDKIEFRIITFRVELILSPLWVV